MSWSATVDSLCVCVFDTWMDVPCTLVTIHNEGECVDLDEAFRQSAEAMRAKGLVVTKTAKTIDVAKAPGPGCAP